MENIINSLLPEISITITLFLILINSLIDHRHFSKTNSMLIIFGIFISIFFLLNQSGSIYYMNEALVNNEFPNNNAIEAFTFYTNDYRYDELHWVELMLEKTKKPLNKCLLKVDDVPQLIKKIATIQDEPFGGFPTLAYSQIFATARKRKIVVLELVNRWRCCYS